MTTAEITLITGLPRSIRLDIQSVGGTSEQRLELRLVHKELHNGDTIVLVASDSKHRATIHLPCELLEDVPAPAAEDPRRVRLTWVV